MCADWSRRSPFSTPPTLPPRQAPHPEPLSASQWMNHFAASEQLWNLPGPPVSAPPSSHISNAAYNPNTYGPMPGAHQSTDVPPAVQQPQNPPSGPRPVSSTWEEHHSYENVDEPATSSKPPLPVGRTVTFSNTTSTPLLIFPIAVAQAICLDISSERSSQLK